MKTKYLLLGLSLIIAACKPNMPRGETEVTQSPVTYPYAMRHPNQWVIDTSGTNARVALNALKAFEKNDTTAMKRCFEDTVLYYSDYSRYRGSISPLLAIIKAKRESIKTIRIKVTDFEAVINKFNNRQQWVTVWYTEKWTSLNGKTDSSEHIDDHQFKNGKILRLDEYTMHFSRK